jgi:hypothetical protein
MTDLILKSFNGVAQQKSYGGNSFETNLRNAEKAIAKIRYTERIWDRSRSQWMLKFLTCSNADGWLRLRQISAEMNRKRMALSEAKFSYMKNLTEAKIKRDEMLEEENENKKLLLEIKSAEFESYAAETLIKVEGAMKEVETLGYMYDSLKKKLDGDITEEEFEKAQTKAHIKRAVMQAIREVKECGKIKCGNAEYLEQSGLSTSAIYGEILAFIEKEAKSGIGDTSLLHSFLDAVADKYQGAAIQQAEWLGFDPNANMNLTYEP